MAETNGEKSNVSFSTHQHRFFDGSGCVLVTASRSVLLGTVVRHKKLSIPKPRWLLVVEVPIAPDSGPGPEKMPADPEGALLDNAARGI